MTHMFLLFFQGEGGGLNIIFLIAPLLLIFYFVLIRPQQKQQQKMQELVAALKINDEIVTNGGIIGRIKEIRETSFIIQSAEKTFLEIGKSAVVGVKAEEVKK
jgi:preprotein translocase subunit YajC